MTGGDKLQAALAAINDRLANAGSSPRVSIGFMEGVKYVDTGIPVATVAAWNEFGTSRAPPRPFFRNMIKKNAPTWGAAMANLLKQTSFDAARTLGLVGKGIEAQLVGSINELTSPRLADSTIARKSRGGTSALGAAMRSPAKPLIDTGFMWRSVDSRVEGA